MKQSQETALKIMALVDEYPSELFSYERKVILENLTDLLARFANEVEDEYMVSFDLGIDQGRNEAEQEFEQQISDLEDKINDLENQIEDSKKEAYTDGFTEGYETAKAEFGN